MLRKIRSIKKMLIAFAVLSVCVAPELSAYNLKGYEWGRTLEETRGSIERSGKTAVFDEKTGTLVFEDKIFGRKCKVSLLFTPKTKLLAGAAIVWADPAVAAAALEDLTKKYGPPAPSSGSRGVRNTYIWYSPVSRNDRIALIGDLRRTVLGYYGGAYYKRYMEESSDNVKAPLSSVSPAEQESAKKGGK